MKGKYAALLSLLAGALFGAGLVVAGMTQPAKVVAFLDFFGEWDPSLAFVMGGAILVYAPLYRWVTRRTRPLLGSKMYLPTKTQLEPRLLMGAALFGIGWGLGGFCPGPGLTSIGSGLTEALVFVGAMLSGMFVFSLIERQ